MKLSAELVTLGGRNGSRYQYAAVVGALTLAGLDPKTAREFLPRNAWSRACRRLAEQRVIDVIREDEEEALFQFSRRHLAEDRTEGGQQIEYRKEIKILLDKESGNLFCRDESVLQQARLELEKCMGERTNNDVTSIVHRLFRANGDLMPLPGAAGVYLVPIKYRDFLRKVETFLSKLGRKPHIVPIPEGTEDGDRTVQETVADYLGSLIQDHEAAVEGFGESTRNGTFDAAAKRINETRVKVEAYALYLMDRKDELLAAVDAAKDKLAEAVERLMGKKEEAPEAEVETEVGEPQEAETEEAEEVEIAF